MTAQGIPAPPSVVGESDLGRIDSFLRWVDCDCPACGGNGWVCENHRNLPWPEFCQCGAGMPCACAEEAGHLLSPDPAPALSPSSSVLGVPVEPETNG